jgi:uncharacterized protein (DUF433 family)
MNLPDFLARDEYGYIHFAGHRIGLNHVVQLFNDGYSPEMLGEKYPTLSVPLIHKAIAFYLANKSEVDAYVAAENAEMERQRSVAKQGPDVDELTRRRQEKQRAETK